jgi:hypothetical protein
VAYFKIQRQHLYGNTEVKRDNPRYVQPILSLRFEIGFSCMRSWSGYQSAATVGLCYNDEAYHTTVLNYCFLIFWGRSQYRRALSHELSSVALTLGSWIRIPLRAWMFSLCMRLFCVYVVLCLGRDLATGWSLSKESYHLWKIITELNKRPTPLMNCKSLWGEKIMFW